MGYKTYHETLDENQAEQEAVMGSAAKLAMSNLADSERDVQRRIRIMNLEAEAHRLKHPPEPYWETVGDATVRASHAEQRVVPAVSEKDLGPFAGDKVAIPQEDTVLVDERFIRDRRMKELDNMVSIQCTPGNFDVNDYMRGFANGLILAQATMRGEEPRYFEAPPEGKGHPLFIEGYNAGLNDAKLEGKFAVQKWMAKLSIMQQSVVLSSIRGLDGMAKFHPAKHVIRYFRRCVLLSAFDGRALLNPYEAGGGSFTGPWPHTMSRGLALDQFMNARDEMPLHYFGHFMHAVQILGYKHPNMEVRMFWHSLYERMVNALHLEPESEERMNRRLCDNPDTWAEREDPSATCSD